MRSRSEECFEGARRRRSPAALGLIALCLALPAQADPPLEAGFRHPPASAKPQTWWHWLNGNVTKAGITADLEAMQRVGVGGAEIFNVDQGIPAGPVRFMSPQWLDMMTFASQEAKRLGLDLAMMNGAGWSSSGGPWTTPGHAMQMLTSSEQRLSGPQRFVGGLPQPLTKLGFYRDIAVLAFRTPPAEAVSLRTAAPQVTASVPGLDTERLTDRNAATAVTLPAPAAGENAWVQFAFASPFRARMLRLQAGPGRAETSGEVQVSDDGRQFRTVQSFRMTREGARARFDPVAARFWRIAVSGKCSLAEVDLSAALRIDDIAGAAAFVRADGPPQAIGTSTPDAVVTGVVDLTARMDAGGRLTWDVPAGEWTVLRCGYTPTGATNEPAPPEGRGPESDKLSREATDAHWAGAMAPVLKAMGPRPGRGLGDVLVDSYEVGSENWSPRFREDFQARRGYDPVPWLPVTTGRVVESTDASQRFLWDLRRTIADLFAENYAGRLAQLAHDQGMVFSAEPYGNGTFEDFQYGGSADIPMGEFWVGDQGSSSCKLAASVGHIYGRKVIGAESFTSVPEHARWANHPYSLKALGDLMYCGGINRFIFHRYAMQPWTDKAPGMTMGPWGIHFERTETWWNQSAAWLKYLARCQFLLQQGVFVADVAAFCGDDAPNTLQSPPGLPRGYDFDGLNMEVLRTRLTARPDGLALPDGMRYRVLTLPNSDAMTPATLRRLVALVQAGAVVLGPKPTHSPSLENFPRADAEVRQMADALWGNADGKTVTEHRFGQGRVFWGKPLPQVLAAIGATPDFQAQGASADTVHYIHRRADGTDIYFVASAAGHDQVAQCSFRVTGRRPELWSPDTGQTTPCAVWRQAGGRTEIPLRFAPSGSVFVVFRAPGTAHFVSVERQGPPQARPAPAPKLTIVKAVYGVLTLPANQADVTHAVQDLVAKGTRRITASNSLGGDPAVNEVKQLLLQYNVNGARQTALLTEGESVELPAEARVVRAIYGLDPSETPPSRAAMDLTARLAAQVKNGELHVVAGNALAGRDPASLVPKQMTVEYQVGGQRKTVTLAENQALDLPEGREERSLPPPYELVLGERDTMGLLARAPGRFTLTRADGRRQQVAVRALPAPLVVPGPWQVTFPPNLGAPPRAVFNRLTSWPLSPDPGVKYFSGTARYQTKFTVPAGLLGSGRRQEIDLGDVQVIAELTVNGHPLGLLWKPPFRADVTGLLRPGANMLEVRVTNLWPNRLIGDEQFPPDITYTSSGSIAAWPLWLLNGTPRPEPRRVTFSTWKHWNKGDDLLPSGLLGPVRIETALLVPLPRP